MKSHASMNRIYRLVWNAALSLWVAVAENAKGRSKGGSARGSVQWDDVEEQGGSGGDGGGAGFRLNTACRAALVLLASLAVLTHEAHAADAANASVSAGTGSVSTLGNTTTINQASQRLAIDWTSLSTAANEALRFNQPNAAAIALNRITGSSPSELLGSLTANGQVFILNPNGVLFGAGSQVNVGGLVASTLSMSNADFMAGNHVFTGSGGSVVNQGTLNAAPGGYLALLAPEVRNEGVMTASLGTALLAAGNKVTLNLDNGSLLGYSIDQGAINALAENKQLIKADGGQVLLSAKAMDSLTTATVNNSGVIEARTIQNKAGRILLMGDMESGTVNVGGTLDASAPTGGDGGFVETSAAHVKVADGARVTTLAAEGSGGHAGKWLIDPNDFTISATGDMSAAAVATALNGGNFEIATATMGTAGGNGDIHVNQAINRTDSNTFTLTAERDININQAIGKSAGGAAGLTMTAAGNIGFNANVFSSSGALAVTANAGGDITGGGTLNTNTGAIDMTAGGSIGDLGQINAGSLKLKATTGELIVNSGVDWRASSFDLYAGTNIRGSDPNSAANVMVLGNGNFTASAGNTGNGRIRVNAFGGAIGTLNLTSQGTGGGGQIDFSSDSAVGNPIITAAHDVSVSVSGNLNFNALTLTGVNQNVNMAANGGTLTLGAFNAGTGNLTLSGGSIAMGGALSAKDLSLSATNGLNINQDLTATGNLALAASNAAIQQTAGALVVGGTTSVNAGAGQVSLTGANSFTGAVSVSNLGANNVAINAGSGSLTLGASSVGSGTLALSATDAAAGDITIANGATVSANGGNVQLTGRDITFNGTGAVTTTGDVYLAGRNIRQGGTGVAVTANNLAIRSSGYVGNSGAADKLNTQVNKLSAVAPGAISVSNTGALTVDTATFAGSTVPGGAIAGVSSTGGAISLATVDTGGATDNLTLNQAVTTTGGSANTITLAADDHYAQNALTVSTVGANVAISAGRTLTATGSGGTAIKTSGAASSMDTNGSDAGNIQLSTSGANGGSITVTGDLTAQGTSGNAGNTTASNNATSGGKGGNVSVTTATAGAGIAISGNVLANGGNGSGGGTNFAWMFGTGGNGGNITLRNTGNSGAGAISVGNLSAQGGQAGYIGNGGSGGTVLVTTAGTGAASITTGTIGTWGGKYVANSQPGSNGGNAGNVTLGTVGAGATIHFDNLDAHGGAGSLNRVNTNYGSATIVSGTGGTVSITTTGANSDITGSGNVSSYVENAGCSNGATCSIGAAGNITLNASNGSVSLAGNANAKGGNALGGAAVANNGGAGGSVTVIAGNANHNVSIGGIDATGGTALAGGTAGASKAVVVTAADGYVQQVPGSWFNGSSVAVSANRGIGAGTGAGDLSQRLGIIPVTGTARNAISGVFTATRQGNTRVIYGGGNVSLAGTQVQNLFTTGDIDIATSNGSLTVNGLGRNGAGNISLSAGGGNDLTINNLSTLSAVNGNIRLEAGRDVIFSGNASAQTTTGDIYVSAGANVQQAGASTALTANNLALRAGGYIGDGAGGDNALNTSVNALSAVAGTNIGISNDKALAIDQVTFGGGTVPGGAINGVSTTGTGNVAVGTTGGALTVTAPVSGADGTLVLSGATDLVLNNTVSNPTRAVQLTAGSGSISGTGQVTAGALTATAATGISLGADAAALTATSTSGPIAVTLANGGGIENVATTGTVNLTATAGNLDVKTVSGSDVTLTASAGAITDANGTANNITATTLTASSRDGIALGANTTGLQSFTTTGATGDIAVSTDNALDTANYSISTDSGSVQNVSLTSNSTSGITVGNAFASTNDNISLTATAGDISLGSAIGAAGLALNAQGSISAPAAINVSGVFELKGGTFSQVGTLPTFSAGDFRISGGTFVRVLGGDGLSTNTAYRIADIYGLQGAGSAGMLDKNFKLANNIDASGTANWNANAGFNPIGSGTQFIGSLDGDGHVIDQLVINRPGETNVGLISSLGGGTVSNLVLTGGSVTGSDTVGALVGLNYGQVTNSHSSAAVSATTSGAGGLVGTNVGTISSSYASGAVTAVGGAQWLGGLVGTNEGAVSGSYATGAVVGTRAGGLVGGNFGGGTISNSYASGAVGAPGGSTVGGLTGANLGTITNSYATGAVTGSFEIGGLVGWDSGGTVTNSFWDTQTTGQAASGGGTGILTADMRKAQTFIDAGWSASNVGGDGSTWRIYEGNTGPLLRGFLTGLNLADTSVTYNGNTQAGATTATAGVSGISAIGRNAGSYRTGYYSNQQGYDIIGGGLNIAKADLTLSSSNVTKTYDGTLSAAGTAVAAAGTALLGGDTASGGSFAFADKNAGSGNKTVTTAGVTVNDGNGGNNYNVSYADNSTSTINKANVTLSTSDVTKTYDGTTSATGAVVVTAGTVFAGDSATGGTFAFTDKNAGSGNKTVTTTGVTVGDGVNNANYNVSYADNTTSTINRANLTLSTSNVTKTYDGTTGATGAVVVTAGTVFAGDSATGGTFAFTDKNAGSGNKTVTTTGVTVGDGVNNANYNVSYADNTTSTINKANVTLSTSDVTKTYDGTTGATGAVVVTAGTVFAGDSATGGTFAFTDKNAGTGNKTVTTSGVTVGDGVNNSNYNVSYADNTTSTISKANLTLSTSNVTKTYDGTTGATGTVVVTAGTVFAGDSATGGTFAFTDKNSGSGNKTVTTAGVTVGDGLNNANYNVSYVDNTTSTINRANLTLTANNVTKTYDGTTSASGTAAVASGTVFSGDSISGGSFAFTDKNAGTGNKTVTTTGVAVNDGNGGNNYNVSYVDNTTSTINKANLTLTTNNVTKTYDGTLAASGTVAVASGTVFGGDSISGGSFAFTDKNAGTGNKTVTTAGVTVNDGNGGNNYNVSYADNTTSTINKANVTLSTSDVTKTYDGTTSATGAVVVTAGTVFAGDSATGGTFAFTDKNAGTGNKTVTTTGVTVGDGVNNANYNVSYADNTTSTINKANLTVTANAVTKTYDGTLGATGTGTVATLAGAGAGEVVNAAGSQAFLDKNAGTSNKTVRASGVTIKDSGNVDVTGNYNIAYVDNTSSTINKANLTVTANVVTKTYDGTTSATGTGTVAALAGAGAGEVVDAAGSQAFLDKNAGTGNKTVRASGVTIKDSGNADVSGNYNIAYVDNTASTINKANVTLSTSDVTKTYDGTTGATGAVVVTAGTVFAGDNTTGGTFAFTDKNAGTGNKTVTTAGVTVGDGVNNGNYNVSYVDNTTSTINKANLTLTTNNVTKTYDGTTSASGTAAVAGGTVFSGDSISGGSFAFTDKNAGTGNKTVTTTGVAVNDGNGGNNYNVSYADNTTSTINKANLTVTANAVIKTYDGTLGATGTGTVAALAGAGAGEVVNAAGSQAFLDKNAGTANKTVRASGVTIKDSGNADVTGNYNIAYVDNTSSTINKANLTLSTSDVTKTYDGTTGATGAVVVTAGTVFAGDSATGGSFVFTDKNAGTGNKTVTTAGVTVGDGVNNANYNVSYANNTTSTINQANLTVSSSNVTKTYDGNTTAAGSATVTGGTLFSGDSLTGGSFAFTNKNAGNGNKTVTTAGVTVGDGVNNGNYNVTYADNTTSTINPFAVSVSGTRSYDGTANLAAGVLNLGPLVGGETLGLAGTATMADKNVGANKALTVAGLSLVDGTGLASNYTFTGGTQQASITQASLTVGSSNVTKTYDGNLSAAGTATVTAGTLFSGDSLTGGTFAFTDKNAGIGNKTVTTSGVTVGDGVNNGNYAVSYASNTTSTINKADLTVTATGVNKVYDGSTVAAVTYGDNRVAGDVVGITGSATFADKNAGTGKAVGVSGISTSGADAGNYNLLNTTTTTTASITPKALTVTANGDTKLYDGSAYHGGNGVRYNGFVVGDSQADIGGTLAYGGSSQGAVATGNYVITPGGLSSISGNYALGFVDGALSITTSNASTAALGNAALVSSYDAALQAVAGVGGSSGGGLGGGAGGFGGGGFGGGDAAADALAAAAAEAGRTGEE
ncbi:YDG domain-containing protein [Polaromonas sp. CT11-55]|uniref:YDG domain-containing protein n=1 Tax=Polaromonas sp. CT11-55 TaxID=3243045 RepID=UPI0039A7709E